LALKFGSGDHIFLLLFKYHENHGVAPSQDHELEPHPRPILVDFNEFSEFFWHVLGTTAYGLMHFTFITHVGIDFPLCSEPT
jgi:hypothetical protein